MNEANKNRRSKKLTFSRETLRTLSETTLNDVVGGYVTQFGCYAISGTCQPGATDASCYMDCQTTLPW